MNIRSFGLAIAAVLAFTSVSFAACEVKYQERDVDRPVASTTNANRTGPVLNGADYTDWATIADTTPLSVTGGGTQTVAMGVFDVTDPDPKNHARIWTVYVNGAGVWNSATDPDTLCAS